MNDKLQMQAKLNHSLSGLKENPFLARRVIAQAKGEPEMKKKISFAFILAMILLILLAVAAVAEVLGINVFELFGRTDSRYAELAPYMNGLGDSFFALLNGIVEVIGRFIVPVLLTQIAAIGLWGIWWSVGIVWSMSGVTAWMRYLGYKKKMK